MEKLIHFVLKGGEVLEYRERVAAAENRKPNPKVEKPRPIPGNGLNLMECLLAKRAEEGLS